MEVLKVMIVDDEPIILQGLTKIIEKGPTPCSEIRCAHDGFDALEKLEKYTPNLLITDIQMPEMDGFQLINKVQSLGLCNRFAILSGYEYKSYLHQAIRSNVIDYLLKPLNKTELYNLLSDVSINLIKESESINTPHDNLNESNFHFRESARLSENTKRIIKYINENYSFDISLDEIAEHVYLHPNYISSLFKKETGLTFIQYLHQYRVKKAKELMLKDPDENLTIISEQVGYQNVRHFYNVFKNYCGVTPGVFREQRYKYRSEIN